MAAMGLLAGCTARGTDEAVTVEESPAPSPAAPIPRGASSGLPARALPPPEATTDAPPLSLTASDGTGLRLLSLDAKASVQEPLAYTELHLVFENPENRTLEGRFTIDLPPHSAISRFAMKIGSRWQEGEVVERQAARVAYEDFLHRKQDPALMEKEAGNRFSARVFPIPARGTKEIIISYSQELPDAEEPYRLPLRGLPKLDALDARILVDRPAAGAPSVATSLGGTATKREIIEVHETDHTPDRDLEVEAFKARSTVGIRNEGTALARVTVEGSLDPEPITDLTILFDSSASRALGFDAKVRRLGDVVEVLRARAGDFSLRVAAFDQDMSLLYEGKASGFGNAQLEALYARRALGASDLANALRRAATISGPQGRVLLLTDGVATAGDDEAAELAAAAKSLEHAGVVRIDAIVDGGLQDRATLQEITTAQLPRNGVVADAELPAARLADKLLRTTLPDVDVSVEGSTWSWPRTVEGLQPGDEVLVYASLPASAAMTVVLEGDQTVRTEVPLTTVDRPLLQRAWTGARIEALQLERGKLDPEDLEGRNRLQARIIELSTTQRVLSDFTALLVLETEYDYRRFDIERRGLSDILVVGRDGLEWLERAKPEAFGTTTTTTITMKKGDGLDHALPQRARAFDPDALAEDSGILGSFGAPGHSLASPPSVANDDDDVWGGLTGTKVGEAYGVGGLGLVGTGRGGGGTGEGTIGLGNTGLIGKGSGGGTGSGYGRGSGAGFGGRGKRVPSVRMAKPKVQGSLDKDIVRRIVRAHINEVRYCYNQGLTRDPSLHGRVAVQFVIDVRGKVPVSTVSQSTLPDAQVSTCIARAIKRWTFPSGRLEGTVVITYPFVLSPGGGDPPPPPPPPTPEELEQQRERQRVIEARLERERAEEAIREQEAERTAQSPYEGRMFDVMTTLHDGKADEALTMALAWNEEAPGDVLSHVALGEVLQAKGQPQAAARAFGSLIDLFPSRADLRRHAGSRLEDLGGSALGLAIDTYEHAVAQRPDHPSSHRLLAFALSRAGEHQRAFEAIVAGASREYPERRFTGATRILTEDAGLIAAAWIAAEPAREAEIQGKVAVAGATVPTAPSTRFVMTWETDSNDVDFHIHDSKGGHAYFSDRTLPSGGSLYADVTTGYGPECFTIEGHASAYPYRFNAHYFSQGPMGYGMGTLQIVEHDGKGGLLFDDRPYLIMKNRAEVELGELKGPLARP